MMQEALGAGTQLAKRMGRGRGDWEELAATDLSGSEFLSAETQRAGQELFVTALCCLTCLLWTFCIEKNQASCLI